MAIGNLILLRGWKTKLDQVIPVISRAVLTRRGAEPLLGWPGRDRTGLAAGARDRRRADVAGGTCLRDDERPKWRRLERALLVLPSRLPQLRPLRLTWAQPRSATGASGSWTRRWPWLLKAAMTRFRCAPSRNGLTSRWALCTGTSLPRSTCWYPP